MVRDAAAGRQLRVIPDHMPWEVAALNEPMAVAYHAVNRTGAEGGRQGRHLRRRPDRTRRGARLPPQGRRHIVVVDIIPSRLEKALEIGADAVINSAEEDVARPPGRTARRRRDADGARRPPRHRHLPRCRRRRRSCRRPSRGIAKHGATLGIVAVHKKPVELDFGSILTTELNIVWSMGYPTEIFEVTDDIIENWEKYAQIISHRFPFDQALEALELATTPGAADKVVVTFD